MNDILAPKEKGCSHHFVYCNQEDSIPRQLLPLPHVLITPATQNHDIEFQTQHFPHLLIILSLSLSPNHLPQKQRHHHPSIPLKKPILLPHTKRLPSKLNIEHRNPGSLFLGFVYVIGSRAYSARAPDDKHQVDGGVGGKPRFYSGEVGGRERVAEAGYGGAEEGCAEGAGGCGWRRLRMKMRIMGVVMVEIVARGICAVEI